VRHSRERRSPQASGRGLECADIQYQPIGAQLAVLHEQVHVIAGLKVSRGVVV